MRGGCLTLEIDDGPPLLQLKIPICGSDLPLGVVKKVSQFPVLPVAETSPLHSFEAPTRRPETRTISTSQTSGTYLIALNPDWAAALGASFGARQRSILCGRITPHVRLPGRWVVCMQGLTHR